MKKLFISILGIATTMSCSKGTSDDVPREGNRVAISLNAGMHSSVDSKASVNGTQFISMTPAFFLTAYQGTQVPTIDWSAVGESGFVNAQVNSDAAGAVALVTQRYYPANSGNKLYFYAHYPLSTSITAGTAITAPILNYTITGQEDIMWAKNDAGHDKNSVSFPLSFVHLLKRVTFKIVADATFETGATVTSLKVTSAKQGVAVTLNTGAISFGTPSGDLTLPIVTGTNDQITAVGTVMDGSLMFESGTTFKVDVTVKGATTYTFTGIDVTLADGSAGVSHEVVLTFKRRQVTATATITPWTNVVGGSEDAS